MTNRLLAGCLSLLVAGASSAAAQAPQANEAAAPVAEAASVKEKKICKREKSASGTRVGTGRICKTQAQWDKAKAKAKADRSAARDSAGGS